MVTEDFELIVEHNVEHNRWQLKDKAQKKNWEQR
jgi:hypothetical protein